jgi:hypothetical protein
MNMRMLLLVAFAALLILSSRVTSAHDENEPVTALMCDTEQEAREFARLSLTVGRNIALEQVNAEFRNPEHRDIQACLPTSGKITVLKNLGEVETDQGYMTLLQVNVMWYFEGHFGGTPREQFMFKKEQSI